MQRKTFLQFLGFSALSLLFTGCCEQQACYYSSPDVVDEVYMHRYGVPVTQQDWGAHGNHGQIVSTLNNGVVVSKSYNSGILDGQTTYTYPHSSCVEKVETYANGVIQRENYYYTSGASKQEVIYNSPTNRDSTCWYESGMAKSRENYQGNLLSSGTYYGEGNQVEAQVENYNGTRIKRDDYGQLQSQDNIENGQQVQKTTFHANGTPKDVVPYVNGQVEGQVRSFHPAGEPKTVEEWQGGMQHGVKTEYVNGEKVAEYAYEGGQKNGLERRFRDGNTVVQEITWVNGMKQGPSRTYVNNAVRTEWFYQDRPISKSNYDMIIMQNSKKKMWNN
jgi:antitoxin component YwqK of YwqJK toxin-antitoxin module